MDDLEFKIIPDEDIDEALSVMIQLLDDDNIDKKIDLNHRKKELKKAQQYNDYKIFGAYLGKKIIATLGLRPSYDPMEPRHGYEINNFIVDKQHRNQGVGKRFLDFINQYVIQHNGSFSIISVEQNNDHANRLYQKAGFKNINLNSYVR